MKPQMPLFLLKQNFLLILLVLAINNTNAQHTFTNYMTSNEVHCLAKEGNYVWVGIEGGVIKYDLSGNIIAWYTMKDGLVSNGVNSIAIDASGNKWFGTYGGVSKFDGVKWTSYLYYDVRSIAVDVTGNVWFGTWGGGVYKFDGSTWTNYTTTNGLADNAVFFIAFDSNGYKWFGTNAGVSKFDGTSWTKYTTANGLANNTITTIAIDGSGNKWFGSWNGGGITKFDGTNWKTYTTSDGLANNVVNAIAIDASGNKWFATWSGISKFDGTNWTNYTTSNGLVDNGVSSIAFDSQGYKWFGTYSHGISKFDGTNWTTYAKTNGLLENHVYSIAIDSKGNKWFGTEVGVSNFNDTTWTSYNSNPIYSIAFDAVGNKWFAGWGVLKFDGTNWTTYFTSNGLVNNTVHAIAIDVSGNKWFGTDSGVSELSGSTWTNYTVNSTSNGLSNNQVYCIAIDASGNKWFGTNGGVSKFDGSNWTKFTTSNGLVNNYVYAIAIDISGNKWFGTNGGVSKFDGTNWTTYTAPGGVVSIAIDAQGNKWFGTWSGVSKFDGLNWITYSTSNGLSDNNIRSIAIDAKGNKWIGTYPAGAIKMSCVAPVASFVPINTCINQNVLLKNNSSKTDTSTIYQWDLDNNTSIDSTKRNISYLATTSNRAVRLRAYNESCYDDTIITITPLTVPTIQTRTPRMRCNAGTITLEATASAGTVNWYNAFSGGNSINTGNTYPTPQLSASKAYYLDATSNGCTTSYRVEITATVNMPPSINSVTSGSCCNSGKVELSAKPSVGSVIWYSADGTVLANNSGRYTTPLISATTTYYVAASNNECISASRTSVTASVIQLSTTQQYNIWGPTVVCGGDKPTFSITIPNATSYTWTLPAGISGTPTSNTINAVFPDNVSWGNTSSIKVMGINGTCTSQVMSLPITFYPVKTPVIKVKWGALLVCKNADNDIKNFQWYDNYQAISGATAQYYNSIGKSGSYYVICTYNNSCSFPSAHVSVNGVKKVSITPNPVNTLATVTLSFMETGSTELCIYNSNGQKIKLFSFDKTDTVQETTINFSDLPSGSYLLKGKTGDEITEGVVFIKK